MSRHRSCRPRRPCSAMGIGAGLIPPGFPRRAGCCPPPALQRSGGPGGRSLPTGSTSTSQISSSPSTFSSHGSESGSTGPYERRKSVSVVDDPRYCSILEREGRTTALTQPSSASGRAGQRWGRARCRRSSLSAAAGLLAAITAAAAFASSQDPGGGAAVSAALPEGFRPEVASDEQGRTRQGEAAPIARAETPLHQPIGSPSA